MYNVFTIMSKKATIRLFNMTGILQLYLTPVLTLTLLMIDSVIKGCVPNVSRSSLICSAVRFFFRAPEEKQENQECEVECRGKIQN